MIPPRLLTPHSAVLWERADAGPIAARVAIAGDFLPAGALAFPEGGCWREMARHLASLFEDVATSFVNLECTLEADGLPSRPLSGLGQVVSARADSLAYLAAVHCQAAGIANNHSYDFGPTGVARTRDAISRFGMTPLGAGCCLREDPEVFVWQGPGDVRVGFWAAAKATRDAARRKREGVEPATLDRARSALRIMTAGGASCCVALLHAGCLRTNRPDPDDVCLMDAIAGSGFDIVAASHSHRISGWKRIARNDGGPAACFYGLGSLVSGYANDFLEREGLVVVAGLNCRGNLVRVEVRPLLLDKNGFGNVPPPEISGSMLARFKQLSVELADGSFARRFYQDMSRGLLELYVRDVRQAYREDGIRGLARKAGRLRMRHVRRLAHKVAG